MMSRCTGIFRVVGFAQYLLAAVSRGSVVLTIWTRRTHGRLKVVKGSGRTGIERLPHFERLTGPDFRQGKNWIYKMVVESVFTLNTNVSIDGAGSKHRMTSSPASNEM